MSEFFFVNDTYASFTNFELTECKPENTCFINQPKIQLEEIFSHRFDDEYGYLHDFAILDNTLFALFRRHLISLNFAETGEFDFKNQTFYNLEEYNKFMNIDVHKTKTGEIFIFLLPKNGIEYFNLNTEVKRSKTIATTALITILRPLSKPTLNFYEDDLFVAAGEHGIKRFFFNSSLQLEEDITNQITALFLEKPELNMVSLAIDTVNHHLAALDYANQELHFLNLSSSGASPAQHFTLTFPIKIFHSPESPLLHGNYYAMGESIISTLEIIEKISYNSTLSQYTGSSTSHTSSNILSMDFTPQYGLLHETNLIKIFHLGFPTLAHFATDFPISSLIAAKFIQIPQQGEVEQVKNEGWKWPMVVYARQKELVVKKVGISGADLMCFTFMNEERLDLNVRAKSPLCEGKNEEGDYGCESACVMEVGFRVDVYEHGIEWQKRKDLILVAVVVILIVFVLSTIIAVVYVLYCKAKRALRKYMRLNDQSALEANMASVGEKQTENEFQGLPLSTAEAENKEKRKNSV